MAAVQISTVEPPLNRTPLIDPAFRLLRRALAVGLIGEHETVHRLDLELLQRIAREASAAGIGRDAAIALMQTNLVTSRLPRLIERLDESLEASPLPQREAPELLRTFERDELASLAGTTSVSLGRYLAGARDWPDDIAARIHWLAMVVSDLQGAYNAFGVRRWFARERAQLGGRSPRQILGARWDPDAEDVERVRQLAASLAGAGAAT